MGGITVINGMPAVELADMFDEEDHTHKIGSMETGDPIPTKKGHHIHVIPGVGETSEHKDGPNHTHSVKTKTGPNIEEEPKKKDQFKGTMTSAVHGKKKKKKKMDDRRKKKKGKGGGGKSYK